MSLYWSLLVCLLVSTLVSSWSPAGLYYAGLQWSPVVSAGLYWSLMVSAGLYWSLISAGLYWSPVVSAGLCWSVHGLLVSTGLHMVSIWSLLQVSAGLYWSQRSLSGLCMVYYWSPLV